MKDLSKDLFVTWEHIYKLLGRKSESTAKKVLREIRIKFGIVRPQLVTRDHVCLFYTISMQQYIDRMQS